MNVKERAFRLWLHAPTPHRSCSLSVTFFSFLGMILCDPLLPILNLATVFMLAKP